MSKQNLGGFVCFSLLISDYCLVLIMLLLQRAGRGLGWRGKVMEPPEGNRSLEVEALIKWETKKFSDQRTLVNRYKQFLTWSQTRMMKEFEFLSNRGILS